MRSSLPQMMNIGHVTSFINSSGLGPGLPVKMFTKQASAPSFSAAWQMDFTRASSTRAGFLYTPASILRVDNNMGPTKGGFKIVIHGDGFGVSAEDEKAAEDKQADDKPAVKTLSIV